MPAPNCAVGSTTPDRGAVPRLNAPLTKLARKSVRGRSSLPRRAKLRLKGNDMDFETFFAKTPATLDEIRSRVAYALERHPQVPQCAIRHRQHAPLQQGRQLDHQPAGRSPPTRCGTHPISSPTSRMLTNSPPRPDLRDCPARPRLAAEFGRHRGGTVRP